MTLPSGSVYVREVVFDSRLIWVGPAAEAAIARAPAALGRSRASWSSWYGGRTSSSSSSSHFSPPCCNKHHHHGHTISLTAAMFSDHCICRVDGPWGGAKPHGRPGTEAEHLHLLHISHLPAATNITIMDIPYPWLLQCSQITVYAGWLGLGT